MDGLRLDYVLMAHFAQMDGNTVLRVIVVHNNDAPDEASGVAFCKSLLGGEWLQCSYNGNIRKQFPGAGYTYDAGADVFISPRPFPSWTLDQNHDWQPPTPKPDGSWQWDEESQSWKSL